MCRRMFSFGPFPLLHQRAAGRVARRVGLTAVTLTALVCRPLVPAIVASDKDSVSVTQRDVTLQETLEKGLQARLPSEFAFIARVVAMVDEGKLPLELVQGTFNWARRKKPYPFPYFERGLKLRAAKIGIEVK